MHLWWKRKGKKTQNEPTSILGGRAVNHPKIRPLKVFYQWGGAGSLKKPHPRDLGIQGLPKTRIGSEQLLPPTGRVTKTQIITAVYYWGRDKGMERDPPWDAGTQERLKGKGGIKVLRKIIWKTSAYLKPKVILEKFEVYGAMKITTETTKPKIQPKFWLDGPPLPLYWFIKGSHDYFHEQILFIVASTLLHTVSDIQPTIIRCKTGRINNLLLRDRAIKKTIQTQLTQLILPNRKFKITMINILERMVGSVNNRYEHMGNFSRKMKTLRAKWKC